MPSDFDAQIRALNDKFQQLLPGKLRDIETAWHAAKTTSVASDAFENLLRLVHTLAGSGTTFGFAHLSDTAKDFEAYLIDLQQQEATFDKATVAQIEVRLQDVARAADVREDVDTSTPSLKQALHNDAESSPAGTEIYWVGENLGLAQRVQKQFGLFHYKVRIFNNQRALEQSLEQRHPAIMILDLYTEKGQFGGRASVERIFAATDQGYPRLVLSPKGHNLEHWLMATKAGAVSCQEKPIDPLNLLGRIHALTTTEEEPPYRVMIMDDDRELSEQVEKILGKAGMMVKQAVEPLHAMQIVETFQPDLILMDLYMSNVSGMDMARLIRQDPRFANIPIVYLSQEKEINKVLAALESGGDDFIFKPVRYRYLYYALCSRIKRARQVGHVLQKDSLTGRLQPSVLRDRLAGAVKETSQRGTSLVLALVAIDFLRSVNDRYSHAVGDRILKALAIMLSRRMGRRALLGRYGGGEFAIVLPDTTLPMAEKLFNRLVQDFGEVQFHSGIGAFRMTLSGGLASYPTCGNLEFLRESAEKALARAQEHGGNRVHFLDVEELPASDAELPEILNLIDWQDDDNDVLVLDDSEAELPMVDAGFEPKAGATSPTASVSPGGDARLNEHDRLSLDATFDELDDPLDVVKVLVVDDDPVLLQHIAMVLEQKDYMVLTARNGDEGFDIALRERPAIVLTDLLLFPGIHGFDLCQRIRQEPSLAATRIVVMTAVYKGYRYRIEGKDAGADAFLEKPLDHSILLGTLSTLMKN